MTKQGTAVAAKHWWQFYTGFYTDKGLPSENAIEDLATKCLS